MIRRRCLFAVTFFLSLVPVFAFDIGAGSLSLRMEDGDILSFGSEKGERALIHLSGFRVVDARQVRTPESGETAMASFQAADGRLIRFQLVSDSPYMLVSMELPAEEGFTPYPAYLSFPTVTTPDYGRHTRTFGTSGLQFQQDSYTFLSVVNQLSGEGMVCGWLTQKEASGIFFSSRSGGAVNIFPRLDFGCGGYEGGNSRQTESFVIGFFEDAARGLELYGEKLASVNKVKVQQRPFLLDTAYSYPDSITLKRLDSLAQQSSDRMEGQLPDVLKIDSGWQRGRYRLGNPGRDFGGTSAARGFPGGLAEAAALIRGRGMMPGLWMMPFSFDAADPGTVIPSDYLLKQSDGSLYDAFWGGNALDLSIDGAAGYLRRRIGNAVNQWGFRFFELDALWTGLGTELLYVSRDYKDDRLGDVSFARKEWTPVAHYREGLDQIRKAAGGDAFLLGSSCAQNMRILGPSIGYLDAMKTGPESSGRWERIRIKMRGRG